MKGAARAAGRRADENTILAYRALHFYALAMSKGLKPLSEYLIEKPKPRKAQTPDEMFAALLDMKMHGAPMNIRKIN